MNESKAKQIALYRLERMSQRTRFFFKHDALPRVGGLRASEITLASIQQMVCAGVGIPPHFFIDYVHTIDQPRRR